MSWQAIPHSDHSLCADLSFANFHFSRSDSNTEESPVVHFLNPFNELIKFNQIPTKSPFTKLKEIKHFKSVLITFIFYTSICLPLTEPFPGPLYLSYSAIPRTAHSTLCVLSRVLYKVSITSLDVYSILLAMYPSILLAFFTATSHWLEL